MLTRDDLMLRRARGGDRDALAVLLKIHGPAVTAAIARQLDSQWRSSLDPEDVMQVTYIEAFLEIVNYDSERASFRTWLSRMAENNLRDAIKGLGRDKRPQPQKRAMASPPNDSYADFLDMLSGEGGTPSRHAAGAEARQLLEAAIERLPPDYRQVVHQYDILGQNVVEVASHMKRSQGSVYMMRARAHDRLRQLLPSVSAIFSNAANT